jgi:hypothetical protein
LAAGLLHRARAASSDQQHTPNQRKRGSHSESSSLTTYWPQ